jgi:NAD(P)-dependent dehydrogenase (short-subunit alcohol dehydrogenase family)
MGDVAVITGAASGIGASCARQFADAGYQVLGIDLAVASNTEHMKFVTGDVASPRTWDRVDEILSSSEWTPSVLVTAAAFLSVGNILDLSQEDWRRTFEVNLFGLIHAVRHVLPAMIARQHGSIITVGSIDSSLAEQGLISYCASKGAILQFTRALALDHARQGVRVNCVCPGVTDTPFFRKHLDSAGDPHKFLRVREERNPLGRLLHPDEVAQIILFLASDAASGVTGAQFMVDAGLTAGFDFRTGTEGA